MKYDVDYFIRKFEAIPDELWRTGSAGFYGNKQKCALGFCRIDEKSFNYLDLSHEGKALINILRPTDNNSRVDSEIVWGINDKHHPKYQQATPKQRIIAALHDVKKMHEPKEIRYVAVSETIKEKELVLN